MLVLAIDTSHQAGGAALAREGRILGEVSLNPAVTHSRRLLAALDFLLERSETSRTDLEGLAVTLGPGYFTGLRIGLATVQGLALALDLPTAGVSTLRLLAEGAALRAGVIWAAADARRGLLYAAPFEAGPDGLKRLAADAALSPERLAGLIQAPALLAGEGAWAYADQLLADGVELAPAWAGLPRPGLLALIGERRLEQGRGLDPALLKPRYCRPSDAEVRFGLPLDGYNLQE